MSKHYSCETPQGLVILRGAFFDLREIAICANRAASGCQRLPVELPAESNFEQLRAISLFRSQVLKFPTAKYPRARLDRMQSQAPLAPLAGLDCKGWRVSPETGDGIAVQPA